MSIRSLIFPKSRFIPLDGGSFEVGSDLIVGDWDDDFSESYNSDLWTLSASTNLATTTGPFGFVFGAGASYGQLDFFDTIPYEKPFCLEFGYDYRKSGSTSGDTNVFQFFMSSAAKYWHLKLVYNDASPDHEINIDSNNGSLTQNSYTFNYYKATFRIFYYGGDIYTYVKHSGNEDFELLDTSSLDFADVITPRMFFEDPDETGTLLLRPFKSLPVLEGVPTRDVLKTCWTSTRKDSYGRFRVDPSLPGDFLVTLNGCGSSTGTSESVDTLTVLNESCKESSMKFLISDIETLYDDGDEVTLCPEFSYESLNNSGSLRAEVTCFCDGSDRDSTALTVRSSKFGRTDQFSDRRNNPEFLIDDGIDRGHNFDFSRLYNGEIGDLFLATSTERLKNLRTFITSDNKRVLYGAAAEQSSAEDVFVELSYDFSWIQDQDLLTEYDEFYWKLIDEYGNVIEEASDDPVTVLNYTDPGNVPTTQSLSPGRYTLVIESRGLSNSETGSREDINQGAKLSATVYKGTTNLDPVWATGFAEAESIKGGELTSLKPINNGVCFVNFEVKESRGHLVCYVHNPCSGDVIGYEDSDLYVSMRDDSLSCVEIGDDLVLLLYLKATDDDLRSERTNNLTARTFNLGNGLFGSEVTIQVPLLKSSEFIHSFDAYKKDDDLYLFCSVEKDWDYLTDDDLTTLNNPNPASIFYNQYSGNERRSIPFSPIGPKGIRVFKLDTYTWDFTGSSTNFRASDYQHGTILLPSLSAFFQKEADVRYAAANITNENEGHFYKRVFPTNIRVNYNAQHGLATLSCLDANTRTPVVLLGSGLDYKEIAIPYHFDIRDNIRTTTVYDERTYTNIDYFSACFGPDAMVYTLCSRDQVVELGIVDPSFYWDERTELVIPSVESGEFAGGDIYIPEYRFEAIPFLSHMKDDEGSDQIFVDLNMDNHYMLAAHQSSDYSKQPLVHTNGHMDSIPFETFCENIWLPEYGSNTDIYSGSLGTYEDEYYELRTTHPLGGFLTGTLSETTAYKARYFMLDRGYKFYARIKTRGDGSDTLSDPFFFSCHPMVGTGDNKFDSPFYKCRLRFKIEGDSSTAQVYNYDTTTWDDLYIFEGLEAGVLDYYILVQQTEEDKMRAMFVIKSFNDVASTLNDSTYSYDFRTTGEEFYPYLDFVGDDSDLTESTTFGVTASASSSGANRDEYVNIYEMGYNTLKADKGVYNVVTTSKDGSDFDLYEDYHYEGIRYRDFDDTKLFSHKTGVPDYKFRIYTLNDSKITNRFHYYNGFSFSLFGSSTYKGDELYLERERVNDVTQITSKNLHGIWYSKNDTQDMYIWADSLDSGLSKFYADTFVVSGCNVPSIKIVGKDLIGDAWTELGEIDLIRYHSDDSNVVEDGVFFNTYLSGMDVGTGLFDRGRFYYYTPSLTDNTGLLLRSSGNEIVGKKATSSTIFSNPDFSIFRSKGFEILDEPVQYRYLGIKLEAFETYEGVFFMESFDFGKYREIPLLYNHDIGSGKDIQLKSDVEFIHTEQGVNLGDKVKNPSFNLEYSFVSAQTFMTVMSMVEKTSFNSKPVWVVEGSNGKHKELTLTLQKEGVKTSVLYDEEGVSYYTLSMTLEGVGE